MGLSLLLVRSDGKKVNNKYVCPIYVKYSYKGTSTRFPTHIFIEEKYWKPGNISNRCPDNINIGRKINSQKRQIEDIITDIIDGGDIPTPSLVKIRYNFITNLKLKGQPKSKSFWMLYEEFLDEKSIHPRSYHKTLKTLKNKLKDFEKKNSNFMSFEYILNGRFESDFRNYCLDLELPYQSKKKKKIIGLSNNYTNKLFTHVRIFLNWCKERKYISEVKRFKKLDEIRHDVLVYLNQEEVTRMFEYKDYDYPKKYPNVVVIEDVVNRNGELILWNNKELVKDIFTFQCSTGSRWGDIHSMNVGMFTEHKGFLTWIMKKTNQRVTVPENDISLPVFKKYSLGKSKEELLFPKYLSQTFNRHLKEIGRKLKFNRIVKREIKVGNDIREESKEYKKTWELLSSHCGRRSFVKNLLDLGTMDYWTIMRLSGHKSINSFQKYISVTDDDLLKGGELYRKKTKEKKKKGKKKKDLEDYSKEEILNYLLDLETKKT